MVPKLFNSRAAPRLINNRVILTAKPGFPIVQRVRQKSPTAGIPAILCGKPHSSRSTFNFFIMNF